MRRLKGLNRAAITRVEATTARVDCWPVSGDEESLQHYDAAEIESNKHGRE